MSPGCAKYHGHTVWLRGSIRLYSLYFPAPTVFLVCHENGFGLVYQLSQIQEIDFELGFCRLYCQLKYLQDVLGADDHATRFFKTCIEVCARDCYRMVVDQPPANVMLAQDQMRLKMAPMLDALSRLLVLIVRFTSEASLVMKLPWLRDPATATAKMLGIIAGVMFSHQESYDVQFLAYPFHRIIYSFFMDLFITEFKFVQIQEQIMLCFCNMFHAIRPQRLPAFTASWLELIFHRDVIRRINEIPEKKGWEMFMQLLVDSIKFVGPFVRNLTLNRPLSVVFRVCAGLPASQFIVRTLTV